MKRTYEFLSKHCDDKIKLALRNSSNGYGDFFEELKVIHNSEEIALITIYSEFLREDLKYLNTIDDFYKLYEDQKSNIDISFLVMCDWLSE